MTNPADAFNALDEFSFHHRLAATPGLALVVFTSTGCGSCRAWKRLLADYRRAHPHLHLFEVDAGHAQALAREFAVFHLPALFLYCDGHYHGALHAVAQSAALEAAIAELLATPAQDPP